MIKTQIVARVMMGSLLLAAVGCVAEVESPNLEAAPADPQESPKSADADRKNRHHRAFGPAAMFVQTALDELELTSDQQATLDELLDDMAPKKAGFAAHKELLDVLRDGLRAGAIDDELVKTKLDEVQQSAADYNDLSIASFNTLHATLSPAQRTQLAAIARERGKKMREHFAAKGKDGKHERHGKDGKHERHGKDGKHHAKGRRAGGPEMWLAAGVDMSDEQREALKTALSEAGFEKPSREEMGAKFTKMQEDMDAMLTAFATDTFDARTHLDSMGADMAGKGLTHYVAVVKALVVILDEDQRNQLAERIGKPPKRGHDKRQRDN